MSGTNPLHTRTLILGTFALAAAGLCAALIATPARAQSGTGNGPDVAPSQDLQVSKTDDVLVVVPGQSLVYTVSITNAGPFDANNALFTDFFPAAFEPLYAHLSVSGGSVSFAAFGTGTLNATYSLSASGRLNIVITGTLGSAAVSITNTAVVTATGFPDPVPANNIAFDVDAVAPGPTFSDARISKTDGTSFAQPGQLLTYTLLITNAGPGVLNGLTFADAFPPYFSPDTAEALLYGGATAGPYTFDTSLLSRTFTMPVDSRIAISIYGQVSAFASGWLTNTAWVTMPAGITDTNPLNNIAIDVDSVGSGPSEADVTVSKTDGRSWVRAGQLLTYTIVVTNAGPAAVSGLAFGDAFPPDYSPSSVQGNADPGVVVNPLTLSSVGLTGVITMPPDTRATFFVGGSVKLTAAGTLTNTAAITLPFGLSDPSPADHVAFDADRVLRNVYLPTALRDAVGNW